MPRFMHIGFYFPQALQTTALEPVMAQVGNWIRYAPPCWIIWTDKNPEQIFQIIKPHVGPSVQFLIAAIDETQNQGWMPKWVWDWMDSKRPQNALGASGLGLAQGGSPLAGFAPHNPLFPPSPFDAGPKKPR